MHCLHGRCQWRDVDSPCARGLCRPLGKHCAPGGRQQACLFTTVVYCQSSGRGADWLARAASRNMPNGNGQIDFTKNTQFCRTSWPMRQTPTEILQLLQIPNSARIRQGGQRETSSGRYTMEIELVAAPRLEDKLMFLTISPTLESGPSLRVSISGRGC